MAQYIDKEKIVAEIERRINEIDEFGTYLSPKGTLTNLLCHLDTIEVKEVDWDDEKIKDYIYAIPHAKTGIPNGWRLSWHEENVIEIAKHFFELGLNINLWKSAEGDDLPEIDREVVVFTQKEGLSPRVGIAHRPNPKGWDGTSISTGKTEHFQPMLYGKGGWSLPDVKIWLDCNLPFKENEVW